MNENNSGKHLFNLQRFIVLLVQHLIPKTKHASLYCFGVLLYLMFFVSNYPFFNFSSGFCL